MGSAATLSPQSQPVESAAWNIRAELGCAKAFLQIPNSEEQLGLEVKIRPLWSLSSLHSWSAACPGVISPFGMTDHPHRPAIPVQNVVSRISVTWDVCWEQQLLMCWHSLLAGLVLGGHFLALQDSAPLRCPEMPQNDGLRMFHCNNKHFLLCSELSPGSSALTPAGGTEAQEVIPVQAQLKFLI